MSVKFNSSPASKILEHFFLIVCVTSFHFPCFQWEAQIVENWKDVSKSICHKFEMYMEK